LSLPLSFSFQFSLQTARRILHLQRLMVVSSSSLHWWLCVLFPPTFSTYEHTHTHLYVNNESSKQCGQKRRKVKQTRSRLPSNRIGRKRNITALHISSIVFACIYVRAGARTKKVSFAKEQHDREQEKRKQYKLQAKCSSSSSLSSIDRPSARRRKSKGKKKMYRCVWSFMKRRTRKKGKGGEEEEGCTYTNAIERVSIHAEKKRRESFLVRAAYCCIIVDENEMHPYYHHHHLFF
jgi:hypothetical protein